MEGADCLAAGPLRPYTRKNLAKNSLYGYNIKYSKADDAET